MYKKKNKRNTIFFNIVIKLKFKGHTTEDLNSETLVPKLSLLPLGQHTHTHTKKSYLDKEREI